jgi:hypothetical protein
MRKVAKLTGMTTLGWVCGLALAGCGQSAGNATNAMAADNGHAATANMVDNGAAPVNSSAAPASGAMTPDQVRALFQRDGVSRTVTAFQDPSWSPTNQAMSEGIAAGDEQWLALVPPLSTSGSAEMAEGLISMLAEALPRNAAGVLRVLGDRQMSATLKESTCMHPEELSGQAARTYLTTAIRAVEAVNDPALQAARTMCLANLRQAQAQIGS